MLNKVALHPLQCPQMVARKVQNFHCVKSVQIRSYSPKTGKHGPEKPPYLDTLYAVFTKRNERYSNV